MAQPRRFSPTLVLDDDGGGPVACFDIDDLGWAQDEKRELWEWVWSQRRPRRGPSPRCDPSVAVHGRDNVDINNADFMRDSPAHNLDQPDSDLSTNLHFLPRLLAWNPQASQLQDR